MNDKRFVNLAKQYEKILELYCSKNGHLNDSQLACKILKEEDIKYDVDYFRKVVKAYRSLELQRRLEPIEDIFNDPDDMELPESYYEDITPFALPKSIKKILILADIHIPYQDNDSLRAAINYGKNEGVDAVLLNGDTIDMYSVSFHERDYDKRDMFTEIKAGREFLMNLRKFFKGIKIYYKVGNHEARYNRFLNDKAPELASMPEYALERILKLQENDIELIEHLRLVEAGKLYIGHGDEFRGGGTINIARNILLRSFDNVLVGHFHKTNEEITPKLSGDRLGSWSVGCLCGLSPRYMPINRWNSGFCIVEIEDDGNFTVHNKKIVGGVVR